MPELQADAQTALIAQNNELTSQTVDEQTTVDQFKDVLGQIKADKASLTEEIPALEQKLGALKESREQLVAMFLDDASNTYPSLKGMSLNQVLSQITAPGIPLATLWAKYQPQVSSVEQQMAESIKDYSEAQAEYAYVVDQETKVLSEYSDFVASASIGVPSVDDLKSEMDIESLIPVSDAQNIIACTSAMDFIDPDARAAIELQVARNEDPELFGVVAAAPTIKGWHVAAGVAALFYLLGGKRA